MAFTQPEALTWRKSTYSSSEGSNCVEVAALPGGGRGVRDSKIHDSPVLRFTANEWQAFIGGVVDGKLR
ncbi:DUF397 domain-containing protein [Sphaerisporangium sp. TRM90804]|uniref:DUF397 domain-containing protein n=1 Tax=Sphaerisporangium sp. TRM90804 TaxID=3031113 RepID=UPI00244C244D|nr:DUF397 domain-containing protein [Sphaerisporangium sp. TRM90804]MDH2424699.1 DUF397 domain-containing protein [Sphaerisporangium sp. TRM90804]